MSDRRFRAEQLLTAIAITAAGLAVGVGLIGRWLWSSMDEAVALPRNPGGAR